MWMWLSSGDFVYSCIYMTHFLSLFILLCLFVAVHMCVYLCGYECIQECMRALWQVYPPPCLCGRVRFLSARSLCTVWVKPELLNLQTAVKNSDDSVFSFLASATRLITQLCFFFFSFFSLASLMWLSESSTGTDSVS